MSMAEWKLATSLRRLLGRSALHDASAADAAPIASPKGLGRADAASDRETLWTRDVPIAGRRVLPPDPRVMKAIGLNHSFESAVADVVDNSLDAGATRVLIRFVRDGDRLLGLCIVDDGKGMDEAAIDRAMTVGGRRDYEPGNLGHFGMGLKAASLGQARVLTVVSRAKGAPAVGRRWVIESAAEGFECDVLEGAFSTAALDRPWRFVDPRTGTLVRWTEVKCFPTRAHAGSVDRYIDETLMNLRQHLGMVFHRVLARGAIRIAVDVEDVGLGETGLLFEVETLDPFGYVKSGRRDYPRRLLTNSSDHALSLRCHIWPGRSNLPNFRLPTAKPDQFQGFFFYRNDRLLQPGGWNGVVHPERNLQLARIEVDIPSGTNSLFSMNAEKTRVETAAAFAPLALEARDDKGTFIDDAKATFRESQKRRRERPKVVAPGKGFARQVRAAIAEEYDFLPGESLAVRWEDLGDDSFFDIDRDGMIIRLNKRYRAAVLGGANATPNDAPMVKALVYLLVEESFRGAFLGAKGKDKLAIWQAVLTAAARAEAK
jgi:hypothetical protein